VEPNLRARLRAGDPDAFGVLFDQHAHAVYNLGFRLTGSWPDAEEVVSAALIPGVTVVADATDAIGRHGVAVALTVEDVRYEWIFSRQTLRYLGERDIYVAKPPDLDVTVGSIADEAAVLQRAFVNHAGQIPG
jgi:hypothetical protein